MGRLERLQWRRSVQPRPILVGGVSPYVYEDELHQLVHLARCLYGVLGVLGPDEMWDELPNGLLREVQGLQQLLRDLL